MHMRPACVRPASTSSGASSGVGGKAAVRTWVCGSALLHCTSNAAASIIGYASRGGSGAYEAD